jgi:hypothetical protein
VRNEHHLFPLTTVEMVITAVGLRSIAESLGGNLSDPASFATKTDEPSYQTDISHRSLFPHHTPKPLRGLADNSFTVVGAF